VVLHRHKRLGLWLQPGGHVDPGESAAEGAARETREETGLDARHPDGGPRLVHVDVHPGPRGHLHLDLRYLLVADGSAPLRPHLGESPDVAWFSPSQASVVADRSAVAAIRAGVLALGGGTR
jgi:8-oxo-dGTP pyrophosphatase MutT (NUDIX family)